MKNHLPMKGLRLLALGMCLGIAKPSLTHAQTSSADMTPLPLDNLSAFRPVADNWRIAGGVTADRNQKEAMKAASGKGVLVNIPSEKKRDNLVTLLEHGDLELELDFMMARESNSGIYLQGRYEVQLLDSWGVKRPGAHDCGAIYERWDDSKPEGQKGYEGHAPRVNVSRAPGLWQHMRIAFQAPRFNAQGQKIENAKVLEVTLNGVTIHENVELTGPTRGPLDAKEVAVGPLLIQGDHGPVAFRNIRYKNFDKAPVQLTNLKYSYYGKFIPNGNTAGAKAETEGTTPELSWEVSKTPNDFTLRYTGTLKIKEAGKYTLTLASGGSSSLKVAGKDLIPFSWGNERSASIELQPGDQPIEITYGKAESWVGPAIALFIEGPGIRRHALHPASAIPMRNPVDPIMMEASNEATLLRSFVDFKRPSDAKAKRIVHAINVGSPSGIHYTMDLDNGALAQVWKGSFLNTTPMWHDRGDGSSRPLGSVVLLNDAPTLQVLANNNAAWSDSLGSTAAYRFRGYDIDENNRPLFKYTIYGAEVEDQLLPDTDGKTLTRNLKVTGPNVANLYVRVAEGSEITPTSDGAYSVNGSEYVIKVEGAKPTVRTVNNRQELLVPVSGTDKGASVRYTYIW